jgi:hypothetical protein
MMSTLEASARNRSEIRSVHRCWSKLTAAVSSQACNYVVGVQVGGFGTAGGGLAVAAGDPSASSISRKS